VIACARHDTSFLALLQPSYWVVSLCPFPGCGHELSTLVSLCAQVLVASVAATAAMLPFGMVIPKLFERANTYISSTEQVRRSIHSRYKAATALIAKKRRQIARLLSPKYGKRGKSRCVSNAARRGGRAGSFFSPSLPSPPPPLHTHTSPTCSLYPRVLTTGHAQRGVRRKQLHAAATPFPSVAFF
jgi:hypothetical protein